MKSELINKLITRFPWLPQSDLGFRWFEVNDGWYDLIHNYCTECETLARAGGFYDRLSVGEIKQKMGFLEMWVGPMKSENGMYELYLKYRALSAKTCERCGRRGKHRVVHGWIYVFCKDCVKPWEKELLEPYPDDNQ